MSLRKIFYLQARFSVLWREEGQKNDVIPSKGFLFPAYLLLAGGLELGRRVQKVRLPLWRPRCRFRRLWKVAGCRFWTKPPESYLTPGRDWWSDFKWKYYVAGYTSMSGQYGNIKRHWMTAASYWIFSISSFYIFTQTSNRNFFWGKLDFTETEIFWDSRAENEFKLKYKRIRIGNVNKNLGYGMSANCAHESDLNNDNEKQNDDERNPDGKHDDVE